MKEAEIPSETVLFLVNVNKTLIERENKEHDFCREKLIQSINEHLLSSLQGYIIWFLNKNYPTFLYNNSFYNDFKNQVYLSVLMALPKYNGKTKITTFITPYIKEGASEYICFIYDRTRYQNKIISKIEKIKSDCIKTNTVLTEEYISKKARVSIHTLRRIYNAQSHIHLENPNCF